MLMSLVILVGAGGFFGSISRYLLGRGIQYILGDLAFPFGTLTINVMGCLVIGFVNGLAETRQFMNPEIRAILVIGFLSGFTTFSAFGYDTLNFLRTGHVAEAITNLLLQLVLGLGAVLLGHLISKTM